MLMASGHKEKVNAHWGIQKEYRFVECGHQKPKGSGRAEGALFLVLLHGMIKSKVTSAVNSIAGLPREKQPFKVTLTPTDKLQLPISQST